MDFLRFLNDAAEETSQTEKNMFLEQRKMEG